MIAIREQIQEDEYEILGYFSGFLCTIILLVPLIGGTKTRSITVFVGAVLFIVALLLTESIPTLTTSSRWYVLTADVVVFAVVLVLILSGMTGPLNSLTLRQFGLLISISVFISLIEIGVDTSVGYTSGTLPALAGRIVFYTGAIMTAIFGLSVRLPYSSRGH